MGNHSDRPGLVKSSAVFRWAGSPQSIGMRTEGDDLHNFTGIRSRRLESGNGSPASPEFLFTTFCLQSSNFDRHDHAHCKQAVFTSQAR
jgi:hypothetical protein